jgi:carbamoyltransferase
MRVVGFSGFENARSFKETVLPGLDEREYRIVQGQDAAAALVIDGEIIAAAAQERFDGKKHSADFPVAAIDSCLREARIALGDVDAFVHGFDYAAFRAHHSLNPLSKRRYEEVYSPEALRRVFRRSLPELCARPDLLHHVEHHRAHAASAYFTSGWDECLVLVLDGMGEIDAITVWHCRNGDLHRIHAQSAADSIGVLYSLVTLHLGFDFNSDEYKIMGLAPYGDPSRYRAFFEESVRLLDDGSIRIPILGLNDSWEEKETYRGTRAHLSEHLLAPRDPSEELCDCHRDVAAALQQRLNETVLHICRHFTRSTGVRRVAMAGGVALNATANGELLRSGACDELYVQPASADDGSALGAALAFSGSHGVVANRRMPVPFLGPQYTESDHEAALLEFAPRVDVERFGSFSETCSAAADRIAKGEVVAWHQGRMEFGPRALGNRSILADPGRPEMRDRINALVKMREGFRPFAPAVTLETVHEWFEVEPGTELPYMILIVGVRERHRAALPAVTHVDGSARVQTVSATDHPTFHELLEAVGRTTGREMILNTSFNVKGQPMVNSPGEAIETFLGTGIDALFLGNTLLTSRGRA